MFIFIGDTELVSDMVKNSILLYHASQVIETFDRIVSLLTKSSSFNEKDKEKLVCLGQKHYHFGLKKEHFLVIFFFFFQ